jgi:hypothetical protein
MAVLSTNNLTLNDWAKRADPDGMIAMVAELLSQTNEVLIDAVFKEGNLPTGERVTIRTGLPTAFWRALNVGIAPSKSTTAQVDESCGILESRSEIDKDLAMLNGNTPQFRLSEDVAFLEAMNQTMATTLFYGDTATEPKSFLGLTPRYGDINAQNAQNMLDGGGDTNAACSSIWLIGWGDQTVYKIFPKGSQAGLYRKDLGEQTVYEAGGAGLRMQALVALYQWKCGLVVKDWRYTVRIHSIEGADAVAQAGAQEPADATELIKLMARAMARIPNYGMCRPAFYMNRTLFSALMLQALSKSNSALGFQEAIGQFGRPQQWLTYLGIPIRKVDALTTTENFL